MHTSAVRPYVSVRILIVSCMPQFGKRRRGRAFSVGGFLGPCRRRRRPGLRTFLGGVSLDLRHRSRHRHRSHIVCKSRSAPRSEPLAICLRASGGPLLSLLNMYYFQPLSHMHVPRRISIYAEWSATARTTQGLRKKSPPDGAPCLNDERGPQKRPKRPPMDC